jgi:2-keto-3-deoxy-L-fuconate dehydrogenase
MDKILMRQSGKTIIITAAGQGIGRASALAMAREGATVWATDLNAELLKSLAEQPNIKTAELNVLKTEDINAFAQKIGPVDVLFNAAGYVHQGDILQTSDQEWDFSMDLNVKSMYRTIRAFLPAMLKQGHGSVINMASMSSSVMLFNGFGFLPPSL